MMTIRDKGLTIIAVSVMQCLIALLFVSIRTWARFRLLNGFRYDDYLLWAAMVLLLGSTGDIIAASYYGLGSHSIHLGLHDYLQIQPYIYAFSVLLPFSLFVTKAAIVASLLLVVVKKIQKIILWVSLGILGLLSTLEFIGLFVQCFPIEGNWDTRIQKKCRFDVDVVGYFLTGYSIVLDFLLAALPWIFFGNLSIGRKEKLVVCMSLSTGVLAGIAGIFRFIALYHFQKSKDRLYDAASLLIWTNTETCVSIICVCLMISRTIYHWYRRDRRISCDSSRVTTGHHAS